MPRHTRPTVPASPMCSLGILKRAVLKGKTFFAYEMLFATNAPIDYEIRQSLGLVDVRLSLVLDHAESQALGQALMPYYTRTQECAWQFHLRGGQPMLRVGYLTEISVTAVDPDHLRSTLVFTDSGAQEIPLRPLDEICPS